MKTIKNILPIIVAALLLPVLANAQERVVVPLTNPGEPGRLSVEVINGSVTVSGYGGDKVIIRYSGGQMEEEEEVTGDGLRRISSNSIGFEITEENNHVEIEGSPMQNVSFDISVPRNFSLTLESVNGSLLVENVSGGGFVLSTVNGEVTLRSVRGCAIINTVNGDITAVFEEVSDNPMAFTNLNGDIDVTFPSNTAFIAKMKSAWGEAYTDFEMNIRSNDDPKSSTESGVYKVSINEWIYGTVNGGGPQYLFKSMRGDIYIRKQ